jgi:hypothetical protein
MGWVFREVKDEADLERVFRFRYRALLASKESAELVAGQTGRIDLHPCDASARHYALFDDLGLPIASVRAATWEAGPAAESVKRIWSRADRGTLSMWLPPFPFLEQVSVESLPADVRDWLSRRTRLIELGRVCTDPRLQRYGPRAFRLLCEGALAAEFCIYDTEQALGLYEARLLPIYAMYGFAPLSDAIIRVGSIDSRLVGLERGELAEGAFWTRVTAQAEELRRVGAIRGEAGPAARQ